MADNRLQYVLLHKDGWEGHESPFGEAIVFESPFIHFIRNVTPGGGREPKLRKDGQPKLTGRGRKGIETEQGRVSRERREKISEMRERQRQQLDAQSADWYPQPSEKDYDTTTPEGRRQYAAAMNAYWVKINEREARNSGKNVLPRAKKAPLAKHDRSGPGRGR